MSGMTRSMPSISSSGNMSPASTRSMSSPCSMASMFLPISPTPPSGMTRTLGVSAKEGHLLRWLGLLGLCRRGRPRGGLQEAREGLEVGLEGLTERRLVQCGGGMEDREDDQAVLAPGLPVHAADRLGREVLVHRVPAERHDDPRPQHGEMPLEPDVARGDLIGPRVAVLGWPVPHDVRDEHLRAVEPDAREELVEELARRADERPALDVLVVAGGLAEEEDARLPAALAGHGLPRAAVQRARGAGPDLGRDVEQRIGQRADYRGAGALRARYSTSVYGRRGISTTSTRNPARSNIPSASSRDGKWSWRASPRVNPSDTLTSSC